MLLIWGSDKAKYFSHEDLTRIRKISPSGKSARAAALASRHARAEYASDGCALPGVVMFPFQSRSVLSLAGYVLILALTPTCGSSVRAQAVTVDGESITEDEIEQRTKLDFVSTHKPSVRQDVINELADDKDKIKEAEKLGVDLGDARVDNAYAQMCSRMHIAQEQLKKSLEGNGVNLDTLRKHIKADMARASLAQLRYNRFRDRPLTR
jgi:hypothetical protein